MSDEEWCARSGYYAPKSEPVGHRRATNFAVCPGCGRRMRLTWNGRFYRHKKRLATHMERRREELRDRR